jgi:hypothetical protein
MPAYDKVSPNPLAGYAPSGALGLDTTTPQLYVSGSAQMWEPVGGGSITFPVTVAQGGTSATTAAGARTNLSAAQSGVNADITQLTALSHTAGTGITIGGGTDSNKAIEVTDGVHDTFWSSNGQLTITQLNCSGNITGAAILSSAGVSTNSLANATPGTPMSVTQGGGGDTALQIVGTGVALQSLLGFTSYPTQTTVGAAGGAAALPATPTGYAQVKMNGTIVVMPYYARA